MTKEQEPKKTLPLTLRAADFYSAVRQATPEIPPAAKKAYPHNKAIDSLVSYFAVNMGKNASDDFQIGVLENMAAICDESPSALNRRIIEQIGFIRDHALEILRQADCLTKKGINLLWISDIKQQTQIIDLTAPNLPALAFLMAANQVASNCGSPPDMEGIVRKRSSFSRVKAIVC